MNNQLQVELTAWLAQFSVIAPYAEIASALVMVCASVIVAGIIYLFVRRVIVRGLNLVVIRSKAIWDDQLIKFKVLEKTAMLVPAFVLFLLLPIVLENYDVVSVVISKILNLWIIILGVQAIYAALDGLNAVADLKLVSRRLPIRSFVQLIKLFLFLVASIIFVSILTGHSPVYFLSGLGVATGFVMLVFKDTILGFVAGIQLAVNRMVSRGDWIQMDKYGADGAVEEVALTTVKVRNWDQTITMIPAYSLVSDSFKNWRGMSESGGRRIKRSVYIDINSVCFLTPEKKEKLTKINLLKRYLPSKIEELVAANEAVSDLDMTVNGRRLTNIGVFRVYLQNYLQQHANVNKKMTLMVRQLAPSSYGLPIELYFFTNDTRWAYYEGIQADIFDHVFAILPEFGLKAFQSPTGNDFNNIES